jgi:hypothetical protein
MKSKKGLVLLFAFHFFSSFGTLLCERKLLQSLTLTDPKSGGQKKPTLALFDTSRQDQYSYAQFIEIAQSGNFNAMFYPISKIIDIPIHDIPIESFDSACFIMCPEFLKTMETSPISKKMLSLIQRFSDIPHKMIILMFPSGAIPHPKPMDALAVLFDTINIDRDATTFSEITNHFLRYPIQSRPIAYDTTLKLPAAGKPFYINGSIDKATALLPIKQDDFSQKIKNLFPLCIYHYNALNNNHVVITNTGLVPTGIEEDFRICPINFDLRRELHTAIHETLWELSQIVTQKRVYMGIDMKRILNQQRTHLPTTIASIGNITEIKGERRSDKVAWMELKCFEPKEKSMHGQQDDLIKFILESKLDYIWISLNPNMYYSPIAKFKDEQKDFLLAISLFTKKLSLAAKSQQVATPQILIGFEIVNNLYNQNLPKEIAQDLYGNNYDDIPSPLDRSFWKNEVTDPLVVFLEKYPRVSNGVKIGGVVLDLEMYGRKTVGCYLPTMGFEPSTIASYMHPPLLQNINPSVFSQYLMNNNLSSHYFLFLEHQASLLGKEVRASLSRCLPKGIIGCYAPNISIDWFYKGFYKGLSSPQRPIHLLTFNAEFDSHRKWLERNDIHAYHLGVLMLSKIQSMEDCEWIHQILQHHDGIWINRFSRLTEPRIADWSLLEQTTLSAADRHAFAQELANAKTQPKRAAATSTE